MVIETDIALIGVPTNSDFVIQSKSILDFVMAYYLCIVSCLFGTRVFQNSDAEPPTPSFAGFFAFTKVLFCYVDTPTRQAFIQRTIKQRQSL